jgi:outer membrane lipoprotein SlyB
MKLLPILTLSLFLIACAGPNPYGPSTENYSTREANHPMHVSHATVLDVQPVTIDSASNIVGKITGGLLGGIAGSSVGGGRGSAAAAVAGAVVGGMIGKKADELYNKANGVQITLQFEDGLVRAIVQEVNSNVFFRKGDQVTVIESPTSKARVIQ